MKKKLIIGVALIMSLFACTTKLVQDSSPVWADNNRYAVEQEVNCDGYRHSVGISGCAYIGNPSENDKLIIPSFLDSTIELQSSNCYPASFSTSGQNLVIPIWTLYTNKNEENCSFTITKTISSIGKEKINRSMIGRFFIKVVPPNPYHSLLSVSLGDSMFKGIGWEQHSLGEEQTELTIHPKGTMGTFIMMCGEDEIYNIKFTKSPFTVTLPSGHSCDFEMSIINLDHSDIEFASFIYEENSYTEDIKTPDVSFKKNKIKFDFSSEVNKDNKKSVVGVMVNEKLCINEFECEVPNDRPIYTVRAITSTLRFFYGQYNSETKAWRKN